MSTDEHRINLSRKGAWTLAAMIDSTPCPPDLLDEFMALRDEIRPPVVRGMRVTDANGSPAKVIASDSTHAWLIDDKGERYTVTIASLTPEWPGTTPGAPE